MSNIPLARLRLETLANRRPDLYREIMPILALMWREPPIRRAGVRSRKVDATVADQVRKAFWSNPDAHQQEIAEAFNLNSGRVSEIVNRARKP